MATPVGAQDGGTAAENALNNAKHKAAGDFFFSMFLYATFLPNINQHSRIAA
jgi:hypothetical protein